MNVRLDISNVGESINFIYLYTHVIQAYNIFTLEFALHIFRLKNLAFTQQISYYGQEL